jgi:hypothetical protein
MSDPTQPRQRITDGGATNIGTVWWDGDELVAEDDRWRIQSRHKGLTATHTISIAVVVIRCRVGLDRRIEAEQCGRLHQIGVDAAIAEDEFRMFTKIGETVRAAKAKQKLDDLAAEVEAMQAARKAAAS